MSGALQFGQPELLWGAALSPLVLALLVAVYYLRRRRLKGFATPAALEKLAGDFSPLRFFLRAIAFSIAVLFLFLAAAQPKYGLKPVPVQRKGVDLVIALDVSRSMDATDVAPSRLQRARRSIETLVNKLAGDRIGLVAFAGEAVLIHPLTAQAPGFLLTLDTLDTDVLPVAGTAIGAAIRASRQAFEDRSLRHRVLIIITDGETHDADALNEAELARAEGILIYTLGIGTAEGAPVPEETRAGGVVSFKKREGRYIISALNAALLQDIARVGNGAFYHWTGEGDILDRLYGTISRMGEVEMTQRYKELMNDIYQYPLATAVIFLAASLIIGERRRRMTR
jgi:Ca-activated chloride channel family protein